MNHARPVSRKQLRPPQLTGSEDELLRWLARNPGPHTAVETIRDSGSTPFRGWRALAALAERELIEHEEDHVQITPAGSAEAARRRGQK